MLSEAQQQFAGRSLNDAVRGIHHSSPCWALVPATAAVCAILFRLLVASWPVSAMMARRHRRLAQRVAHGRDPDEVAVGTPLSLHAGEAGCAPGTSRDASLRVDAASRVLSSIHAVVAVALAVSLYFQTEYVGCLGKEHAAGSCCASQVGTVVEIRLRWGVRRVSTVCMRCVLPRHPGFMMWNNWLLLLWCRRNDALLVTAGYILYDLVLCIVHKVGVLACALPWRRSLHSHACAQETLGDVFTLAHHAIVLASLAIGVHYGFGTFYMQVLLFAELSTLFINNRYGTAVYTKSC